MATIYEEKEITLFDGTTIKTRPLKISLLRKFMEKFDGIAEVADDNNKSMDVLMDCVRIALVQYNPTLLEKTNEELEDLFDLPTLYQLVEDASGINLAEGALLGGGIA